MYKPVVKPQTDIAHCHNTTTNEQKTPLFKPYQHSVSLSRPKTGVLLSQAAPRHQIVHHPVLHPPRKPPCASRNARHASWHHAIDNIVNEVTMEKNARTHSGPIMVMKITNAATTPIKMPWTFSMGSIFRLLTENGRITYRRIIRNVRQFTINHDGRP